jgi:hypothetical protein
MDDSGEILPFSARIGGLPKSAAPPGGEESPDEAVAPGEAFAVVKGGRAASSLEFIRRDGRSFCVPYSYAPLLWWNPPGSLVIEYPGFFSVVLRGSNLAGLHRRLRDRKVTWICETGEIDTAGGVAAVMTLEIVHSFPSREYAASTETT